MSRYRVHRPLTVEDKRIDAGEVVEDLPSGSAKWLKDRGHVTLIPKGANADDYPALDPSAPESTVDPAAEVQIGEPAPLEPVTGEELEAAKGSMGDEAQIPAPDQELAPANTTPEEAAEDSPADAEAKVEVPTESTDAEQQERAEVQPNEEPEASPADGEEAQS